MATGSSDLSILIEKAKEPLDRSDPNAIQILSKLVGYDGMRIEEAAEQLNLDPDVVRDALALIPRFGALVDAYRGAKIRDIHGEVVTRVSDALHGDGIAEEAARLYRVAMALYKEVRTGERESQKQESKKAKPKKTPAAPMRVGAVQSVDSNKVYDVEGEIIDAEFVEDDNGSGAEDTDG